MEKERKKKISLDRQLKVEKNNLLLFNRVLTRLVQEGLLELEKYRLVLIVVFDPDILVNDLLDKIRSLKGVTTVSQIKASRFNSFHRRGVILDIHYVVHDDNESELAKNIASETKKIDGVDLVKIKRREMLNKNL